MRRWQRFAWRLLIAALLALALGYAPLPDLLAAVQLPLAVLLFTCGAGKLLYDTLFYDHYWP